MLCHDCRGTESGVELCPYHSKLEQRIATLEAILANRIEEERERRRYALLEAAASIDAYPYHMSVAECIRRAEEMLAEIEKREKREPPEATK